MFALTASCIENTEFPHCLVPRYSKVLGHQRLPSQRMIVCMCPSMILHPILPTKSPSAYGTLVRIPRNMNCFDMTHQLCVASEGAWEGAAFPFTSFAGCCFCRRSGIILVARLQTVDFIVVHVIGLAVDSREGELHPVLVLITVVIIQMTGTWHQSFLEVMVVAIVLKRCDDAVFKQGHLRHTSRSLLSTSRYRSVIAC